MDGKTLAVIEAYLCRGASHRMIQRSILGMDAPKRGGGYRAMSILHGYGITEKYKGVLGGRGLDRDLFSRIPHIKMYLEVINSCDPHTTLLEIEKQLQGYSCKETEKFVEENIVKIAEIFRAKNLPMNYSLESLIQLEEVLQHVWKSELHRKLVKYLGSYFGEVVRKNSGGQWKRGESSGHRYLSRVGANRSTVFPFKEAETCLANRWNSIIDQRYNDCTR